MVLKDAVIPVLTCIWSIVLVIFASVVIWDMRNPLVMRYASALLAIGVISFVTSAYYSLYHLYWEDEEFPEARSPVDPFPNCGLCLGVNGSALATVVLSCLIIVDEKTVNTSVSEKNETYDFAAVVIAGASIIWFASAYSLIKKGVWLYKA